MTEEQKKISSKNKQKARDYFNIIGQKDLVLHHKDWTLRHNDIERYILWLPEDLVVMKRSEHTKIHWVFDKEERCKHISESKKGKSSVLKGRIRPNISKSLLGKSKSEEHRKHISECQKGKVLSEEHKNKISAAMKGKSSGPTGMKWKLENGKRVYYAAT